ncbi:ferredoxin [Neolentinus lepideus HHB14362 ss-1]|uniref:Ferredoxin n=1 Tax=Neolentinus lepideus HHB14362 ss-1 TaxID=1314782 RepID=A0A165QVC9_9AGAM|nr:ferredoxin [Neolentinus lepideus HHB14362 ss-1]
MSVRVLLTSLSPICSSLSCRRQAQKSGRIISWISSSCQAEQERRTSMSSSSRSLLSYLPKSRRIHTTSAVQHGNVTRPEPGTGIKVHFKDAKGNDIKTIEANEGDDLLSLAHEHDIDLEGSIACSTCHVILSPDHYDLLPEPSDDENDMLDMAFGLTDTSRLGCQVKVTRELDGMVAQLPSATRNMFVDGKKPTHH